MSFLERLPTLLAPLAAPRPSQVVHREECTQCFDDQDGPNGIDVCLTCFNGGCPSGSTNQHGLRHFKKTGHALAVNIKRIKKAVPKSKRDSSEPPVKKLAIREEAPEHEKYEFVTVGKLYEGEGSHSLGQDDKLDGLIAAVLASMSSAQKSEVKAWEEEITTCIHTTDLVQPESKTLEPAGLAACAHPGCGLTSNLWLCLVCGSLGCGRQQFGGGGGNGHGVEHTQTTGHSVAVKIGTIEPEGTADVYCYACDDAKLDPHLAKHLGNFGIEVAAQTKTEKSMTELQVEQNFSFDFAMTGEDGKELEPMFGPGLTGLRNLGNSCYMASTLQTLFSLPTFQERYLTSFFPHTVNCTNSSPATCFECQMAKIADGLLSGRYSLPRQPEEPDAAFAHPPPSADLPSAPPAPTLAFQEGIRPSMFKALVGKDHAEFATMKQQDAGEFLRHLLEVIRRSARASDSEDPTGIFGFAVEERLQCSECKGVRYSTTNEESLTVPVDSIAKKSDDMVVGDAKEKVEYLPVELLGCLESYTSPSETDDWSCPKCERKVTAIKSTRLATFPDVLVVNASRFKYINWVPQKVEVPIVVPYKSLSLDQFLAVGIQEGEQELPQSAEEVPQVVFNPAAMGELQQMGFPEIRCQRALLATGNSSAEDAMNWLFGHMEDADIDDPLPPPTTSGASATTGEPLDGQIAEITQMGFTAGQARKALRETGGDIGRAVEWVFNHPDDQGDDGSAVAGGAATPAAKVLPGSSTLPAQYRLKAFISHKGPSIHSGHYVAHVWMGDEQGWVLFNDEKVVRAEGGAQSAEALMPLAYVYVFTRI